MSQGAGNQEASLEAVFILRPELKLKVTTTPIVSAIPQDKEKDDFEVLVRVEAPQLVVERAPIDLVVVVDVSPSMAWLPEAEKLPDRMKGEKSRMDHVKAALTFIVNKMLHDDDRLGTVEFSGKVERCTELKQMAGSRDAVLAWVHSLGDIHYGGTVFRPALKRAIEILQKRTSTSPVASILFLSDGEEFPTEGSVDDLKWDRVRADPTHPFQRYPIHTFGFSKFHDPMALLAIATASYGTYSFVNQYLDKIKDAFAVCLAGLSTVAAVDTTVALRAAPGVTIVGIDSGGYNKAVKQEGKCGDICIPVLYAGEVKNFIVHLRLRVLPAATAVDGVQVLLTAGGCTSYAKATDDSASSLVKVKVDDAEVSIQRPPAGDHGDGGTPPNKVVLKQLARFQLLSLLDKLLKDKELLANKAHWLNSQWNEWKQKSSIMSNEFDKDVYEIADNQELFYTCSYLSSQQMERSTTMGSPGNVSFDTPAIREELLNAYKGDDEPAAPSATVLQQREFNLKVTTMPIQSLLPKEMETHDFQVLVRVEAPRMVAEHTPIDLVAVLDVSGSMGFQPSEDEAPAEGEQSRMDHLKAAMSFLIMKLQDDDRLAIVQFNHMVTRSTPLAPISGGGRESALRLVDELVPSGGTTFKPALEEAHRILGPERAKDNSSNRVAFIVFLSDGQEQHQQNSSFIQWDTVTAHPFGKELRKHPAVYTFGLGRFHEPTALWGISRASLGTYSFVDNDPGKLKDAVSFCVGDLSTAVTVNATIGLLARDGVTIVGIDSGGFNNAVNKDGRSGEIYIPMLYAGEVKNFIVHLGLRPAATAGQQVLFTINLAKDDDINATADCASIQRPDLGDGSCQPDKVVLEHVTRFKLLKLLDEVPKEELRAKPGREKWANWLRKNWTELKESSSSLSSVFDQEVDEMVRKLDEQDLGHAHLCSYLSSHLMERATTKGEPLNPVDGEPPSSSSVRSRRLYLKVPLFLLSLLIIYIFIIRPFTTIPLSRSATKTIASEFL